MGETRDGAHEHRWDREQGRRVRGVRVLGIRATYQRTCLDCGQRQVFRDGSGGSFGWFDALTSVAAPPSRGTAERPPLDLMKALGDTLSTAEPRAPEQSGAEWLREIVAPHPETPGDQP